MRLDDDERDELRQTARSFLDDTMSSARVRGLLDDDTGFDRTTWAKMGELGWPAIHIPERFGGMGASYTDVIVILHELGRHVAPTPFLASAVLGAEALMAGDNLSLRSAWLPDVASGQRLITVAAAGTNGSHDPRSVGMSWATTATVSTLSLTGTARFVPDAHVADGIIVAATAPDGGVAFALIDPAAAGVRITVEPTVDQTRRLARVDLDRVDVAESQLLGEPGHLTGLQHRLTSIGAVAVSADSLGAAELMLEVTSQYAKERMQFGRPIGSFQAVKHHCANMLIAVEATRAAVAHAADALDDPAEDLHGAASVAKSFSGPACSEVCQTAVQVHGGIGFTWEHDAHLYLKRAKLNEALFGSTSWHRRRLASQLLGP